MNMKPPFFYKRFIAIFKIIANIRMNETTLNSQKTIHFEGRVESRLEEHPVSML